MSEQVIVAALGAMAVLGAAGFGFLGILVQRVNSKAHRAARDSAATRTDAAATRRQVENDHTTNLREEGDTRHNENAGKLDQIISDIGGIRSDIRRLNRRDDSLSDRLDTLTDTIPRGHNQWPNTPPQTTPPSSTRANDPSAPSRKGSPSTSRSPWAPGPPPPSRP